MIYFKLHLRTLGAALLALLAVQVHADGFNGSLSGSWWNPERNGEGQFISFERVGERNVAIIAYFTYDQEGRARWMVGNADFQAGSQQLDISMISARGTRFGGAFDPESVVIEEAGRVELRFIDCQRIGFSYEGAGEALEFDLERLVGPTEGSDCDTNDDPAQNEAWSGAHTGAWWDPARGGEGQFLAIETLGDRRIATFYYFTFDGEGRPSWRVGSAEMAPGQRWLRFELVTGQGARFGADFDPADIKLEPAGRASLRSTACQSIRLRIDAELSFGLDLARLGGSPIGLPCPIEDPNPGTADQALSALIDDHELIGDPSVGRQLPGIDSPVAQLGKLLFFSKTLGGELDVACASCHHPALGGADRLALSIGPGAIDQDLLGPGRRRADGQIEMHRNANTFFNTGLLDRGLFWDSRIESLSAADGMNGSTGGIRTPDQPVGQADPAAGPNLLSAQARFPVRAKAEMRGDALPGFDDEAVRNHLSERIGNHGAGQGLLPESEWLARFRTAFDSDAEAESLITFANIARALGEYQRSAIFVESPWTQYLRGDFDAIDSQAKAGALLFYNTVEDGGMNCVRCHSGDRFTNEQHRRVGFPQIGPGFGDGEADDFGRIRETGEPADQYAFRVPGLLNVELTAPYGHSGLYNTLNAVAGHYFNPTGTVLGQVSLRNWCALPPFDTMPDCGSKADRVLANSQATLAAMEADRVERPEESMPRIPVGLSNAENFDALVAFLKTLTDPCLKDRACYGRWIPTPDEAPDGFQLNALNAEGEHL